MSGPVVFRISGAALSGDSFPAQHFGRFSIGAIYKLFPQRSSDKLAEQVLQPDAQVVAVKVTGGPLLVLNARHARDLFVSVNTPVRGDKDDVAVTSTLPWTVPRPGRQYGAKLTPADATIDWMAILDDKAEQPPPSIGALAATLDAEHPCGLHTLATAAGSDMPGPDSQEKQPMLIFLHGTFASAEATFNAMWDCDEEGKSQWKDLLGRYGAQQVKCFEHATLTRSPIQNALALANALPSGAAVDFVTHGSGGLIAEVLLRAAHADDTAKIEEYFQGEDKDDLKALQQRLRTNPVTVRRVVRIACPARGTQLASHRLDAWLSVCLWLARISGLSPSDGWFDLLNQLALTPDTIAQLPGLAAMLPTSGLIRWLNAPLANVDSELYVIAGDSEGDSLLAWLQTLVSDAFFWTDNDMVVQTRTMYGGVPRQPGKAGPKLLLLRDDKITHFTYFQRRKALQAIHAALRPQPDASDTDAPEAAWTAIGPRSWGTEDDGLSRPDPPSSPPPADASKPWLLLIPDMFGSVLLDADGKRLWLDEASIANYQRLDVAAPDSGAVRADHVAGPFYGDLRAHLARSHHVLEFPYDWRADIDANAALLGKFIDDRLNALTLGEQPLRILAHGAGGLLVRAWHAGHRASWSRVIARAGARILMLGVPQAGSWLPLRLFSGDETFGTLFSTSLPISEGRKLREMLARMPGIVQLQAGLTGDAAPLATSAQWAALRSEEFRQLREYDDWHGKPPADGDHPRHLDQWAIPAPAQLQAASAFWLRLERALPDLLHDSDKLVLVAGTGYATVDDVAAKEHDLLFFTTKEGDRQVTLDSAALPGTPLWLIGAPHDALMRTPGAYAALAELLADGRTSRLTQVRRNGPRGAAPGSPLTRRLPSHGGRVFATEDLPELLALAGAADDHVDDELAVRVRHGDLRFVREPLLIGHYRSMTLTGTEAAVDGLIDQRMSQALRTGVYPERVGSFQIFENGRHHGVGRRKQRYIPRPSAAIVVGLGEEGKLNAQQLSYTVRIGVLAYAERSTEMPGHRDRFELAVALVGSGGTGITVSMATVALLQGVQDANVRLREAGWPAIATLTIVEVYLDRASDALRVLNMQAKSTPKLCVEKFLVPGDGGLRRPLDTSYRGADYDFISALRSPESSPAAPVIAYALDTRRARTEVRALRAQGSLVNDLVCRSSNTTRWDRQIGRTLFNLLIPVEIEPYLSGSSDMLMELDETTAALPWEMIDTDPPQALAQDAALRPWAIRSKVLRKLRMDDYRDHLTDAATEDKILVIGDPLTPGAQYPALDGARREADGIAAVARTALGVRRENVVQLSERPDATTIINALFAHPYRIVHIAGHGASAAGHHRGGVVLSGIDTFLGPSEVKAMRVTPALVFLNCCHLAKMSGQRDYDRVAFAATIARELIGIGVRCVIAAGWAVEDGPANIFADTFYREIFAGRRFIDAVGAARNAAYEHKKESNTWAAYQCYGDPDWSWKPASGTILPSPEQEYEGVAAPSTLILVLQAIKTELLYATQDTEARNRSRLQYLQKRFARWTDGGAVAQEFASAFAALPDRVSAVRWFEKASKAKDGTGSITVVELHAEQLSLPGANRADLAKAIGLLSKQCADYGPSLQRLALLGNAYRRLSMLLLTAPGKEDHELSIQHLKDACHQYQAAAKSEPEAIARFYPLRAAIACTVRQTLSRQFLTKGKDRPELASLLGKDAESLERELAEVSLEIQRGLRENPNFWPIVAQSELEILKGILKMNLAARRKDISTSLADLHKRINTRRFWAYVYDDAFAVLGLYGEVLKEDAQQAELEAAHALLRDLQQYSVGTGKPAEANSRSRQQTTPPVSPPHQIRRDAMDTQTFSSPEELQRFLADRFASNSPDWPAPPQGYAPLLSTLTPSLKEEAEPVRGAIAPLRWVIRDDDLKLFDAITEGMKISAPFVPLSALVPSSSAVATAIISVTVTLMKLLHNARNGVRLGKEDFALISLLRSHPDGMHEKEIARRLTDMHIPWTEEVLQDHLQQLTEVPTAAGRVSLIWKSTDELWRPNGI